MTSESERLQEEHERVMRFARLELDDCAELVETARGPWLRAKRGGHNLRTMTEAANWLRDEMMPSHDIVDHLCGGAIRKAHTVNLHWWLPRAPRHGELVAAIKEWLGARS